MINSKFNLQVAFLFLVLGLLIYFPSLQSDFFFDDVSEIVQNNSIKQFPQVNLIWQNFKTRFIPYTTFSINYFFSRDNAQSYHLTNLFLHIITSLLVFTLSRLIFKRVLNVKDFAYKRIEIAALFCGLLFLVHPIQTQAVSYISQRISILAAFLYIGSVTFYFLYKSYQRKLFYAWSLIFCILAMLCKENAFTLPLMIILADSILFKDYFWKNRINFLRMVPFLLTFFIIPGLLMFEDLQVRGLGSLTKETILISRWDYFLTQIHVIGKYLSLLFLPLNQNVDYDFPIIKNLWNLSTIALFMIFTFLILFAVYIHKRKPILAFGLLWFFVTLSVESTFIPISDVIQEHRLYLPIVGFILVTFQVFSIGIKNEKLYLLFMTLIILILSILTYQRNILWHDPKLLWQNTIAKSPQKARAYQNLGAIYLDDKNFDSARQYFQQAIALDPADYWSDINLSMIAFEEEKYQEALMNINVALRKSPKNSMVWNNLGSIYVKMNEILKAKNAFEVALQYDPLMIEPRLNLIELYQKENKLLEAENMCREVLMIDSQNESAWFLLAKIYIAQQKNNEILIMKKDLFENVRTSKRLTMLGSLFAERQWNQLALESFMKSLQRDAFYPDGYIELGKFYANQGYFNKAIETWEAGQKISGDDMRFAALLVEIRRLQE